MIPLAFVDVETTGLSPSEDRIAEIGVVTVDGERVEHWTALLAASSRATDPVSATTGRLPTFREVASGLACRLAGSLLVAHNARFDYAFLRAEFDRVGIAFTPQVLCTVALSRRLHPHLPHHDLDSLALQHRLAVETRHRALPDADLLWQWWQLMRRRCAPDVLAAAIATLLAGPVLPAGLDPRMIERLPEAPGAYVFRGDDGTALFAGAAGNLRRQVENYFRVDRASRRALEFAHRVGSIHWHATRGIVGARLHAALLDRARPATARAAAAPVYTWQLVPDVNPAISISKLDFRRVECASHSFGIFATERRAKNALVRLAAGHHLCHRLLGIGGEDATGCTACRVNCRDCRCSDPVERSRGLVRTLAALRPLRVFEWPFPGPLGIRERDEIHVVDRWHFLGTARDDSELLELLQCGAGEFDGRLYRMLSRILPRLPAARLIDLSPLVATSCGTPSRVREPLPW
jgi:DNA polymerase-3 subunit epsilon